MPCNAMAWSAFPIFPPLQFHYLFDETLHALGAVLPHPLCKVGVSVQGKGRCGVAQIALDGLYIIPGPDSVDGVGVAQIVKADPLQACGFGERPEMLDRRAHV